MSINKTASFLDILVINQIEYSTKTISEKTIVTQLTNLVNSIMVKCLTTKARRKKVNDNFDALLKFEYTVSDLKFKTVEKTKISKGNALSALRRGTTSEDIDKYKTLKNPFNDINLDIDFIKLIWEINRNEKNEIYYLTNTNAVAGVWLHSSDADLKKSPLFDYNAIFFQEIMTAPKLVENEINKIVDWQENVLKAKWKEENAEFKKREEQRESLNKAKRTFEVTNLVQYVN